MDLPQLERSGAASKVDARATAAALKREANTVRTAVQSPRCFVRWEADDSGDMFAVWINEGCEGEKSVNCSELKRRMDDLVKSFGADIMKSRKGNAVSIELPTWKAGQA